MKKAFIRIVFNKIKIKKELEDRLLKKDINIIDILKIKHCLKIRTKKRSLNHG